MIGWPIAVALRSGLFDQVIVSTDDEEIAKIARQAGAEVPFLRPKELADDHTGTTDVVIHALNWATENGVSVDAACCIYATSAFITEEDLATARDMLSNECDFAFPAIRYGHPPQRGFIQTEDGRPELLFPKYQETRTQDLPAVFHDAGQFYWGKCEAWLERRPFFGARTRFIELPEWRAVDIDRPEDWERAERLFQAQKGSRA